MYTVFLAIVMEPVCDCVVKRIVVDEEPAGSGTIPLFRAGVDLNPVVVTDSRPLPCTLSIDINKAHVAFNTVEECLFWCNLCLSRPTCSTLSVMPAIVIVLVRLTTSGVAYTVNVINFDPDPSASDETCNQSQFAVADQFTHYTSVSRTEAFVSAATTIMFVSLSRAF